jgi:Fe-S cluster biogenesis protein NfuA
MKNKIEEKIKESLDTIRPSLQADGGDIDFVSFDEKKGIVKVSLVGHCAHCPMSQITLKEGVEAILKKEVPEVKEVINL